MSTMAIRVLLVCLLLLTFPTLPVWGQNSPDRPPDSQKTQEEGVADRIINPFSDLWLLSMQSEFQWYDGSITDKKRLVNITLIQPVMPVALTENWRMVVRPVIPFASFPFSGFAYEEGPKGPIPRPNFDRHSGLGDMVLWTAFTNMYTPPNVFGFGPTMMLPTGSYKTLTTGKFNLGPMAAALHTGNKWIFGVVAQHWWTVTGDSSRSHVNLTDVQYVLRYRLTPFTNIGCSPNMRVNWVADGRNRLTFPIGFGGETLIKLGPLPVRIGTEFHYYPITPEVAGPQFNLKITLTPVIPAPEWSKRPFF